MSPGRIVPTGVEASIERLASRELVIVSGKGGVGRTTVAALLGARIAQRGRRVLVATTGHDDRLAWMLGLPSLSSTPTTAREGLDVVRLEPRVCVREYGALIVRSDRIAKAVFDNRVVRRLLTSIPGFDDFAVLGKAWHEAARATTYETVVFDGPATGHLLYTLGVPRAIQAAMPPGPLTKEADLMDACLTDPTRSEAVLVGLPEAWPLTELAQLGQALRRDIGLAVETIVVNGVWPSVSAPARTVLDTALATDGEAGEPLRWLATIVDGGRSHAEAIAEFAGSEQAAVCEASQLVVLPWRFGGLESIDELATTQTSAGVSSHIS
jgi:anion-transporting  ArsA/GET3 family ATPase